MQDQSFKGNK